MSNGLSLTFMEYFYNNHRYDVAYFLLTMLAIGAIAIWFSWKEDQEK